MSHATDADDSSDTRPALARLIDHLSHLLPAQGPISIFIHHNTLHAFEDLPFEEAVEQAAERFGREPFLSEDRYRMKVASGRILAKDVETLLDEELGARGAERIASVTTRLDLWRRVVLHGIPPFTGRGLSWILEETDALSRFRHDIPRDARLVPLALDDLDADREMERQAVQRLWDACLRATGRAGDDPLREQRPPIRHRDLLVGAAGIDTDEWIHPTLVRFVAGFLDQGLAHWIMPDRDRGMHGCFLAVYGTSLAARSGPWAQSLPRLLADDRRRQRDALSSIEGSLAELGVSPDERTDFLTATLLALRGWAGMVRQLEERPDRVPATELPAALSGYLAVRLLLERSALAHAALTIGFQGPLSTLRSFLAERLPRPPRPTPAERAWPIFHVAQLCGLDASIVNGFTASDVAHVESELYAIDSLRRRRFLHRAFERTIRHRLYDALIRHAPAPQMPTPDFQAIFCIDEREESFRRHLEEVEPACETFGTPGFFNVAMYHQSASDAHPRPLCPVAIRPEHFVPEIEENADALVGRSRRAQRRAAGFLGYNVQQGSRMLLRGALLMTLVGWLSLVPLVLRVVFPWLVSRWGRVRETSIAAARTRLQLDRTAAIPPVGKHAGFTVPEMSAMVRRVLDDIGLSTRLSRLVLVVGHGSVSLNNPHESAHDCGACGGGRGGPNARAFAQMANDPRVRQDLAAGGLMLPLSCWFVGAERNTCSNSVTLFDEDLVPADLRPTLDRVHQAIEMARRREAHERCRRFDAVPGWYPPVAALAHVEGRAADLAQPRPEYGHATNAFCIVGRRARTRGLFLDRRAFLVSYDPARDGDGAILSRVLAAVVPVVAGINLEYYFSYVDPTGYGCGTKLPHNVTSLLGVMDGAQSDLRTGLPWQMVEVHEATRLALVVEAPRERLRQVVDANPAVARLVRNRWIWLACLDVDGGALWELRVEGFRPHVPEHPLRVVIGESAAWYQGKRGFLPPVAIVPAPPPRVFPSADPAGRP